MRSLWCRLLPVAVSMFCLLRPAYADVSVVATIKPVHSLVAAVMEGVGAPHLIVKGAASPHFYALKPSDAEALQRANVIFWIGPDIETFLASKLENAPAGTRVVALGHSPGVRQLRYGEFGAGDGHDHGGVSHHHDHHGAEKSPDNPHVWLDPVNAQAMVKAIGRTLSEVDPGHRDVYARNVASTVARLETLDRDLAARLKAIQGRKYLVFHDAFQHFGSRYAVPAAGVISLGGGRAPGARRLLALRTLIKREGVRCVFSEPQFEPRIIKPIIESGHVRSGVLDPLGASLPAGPQLYFALLRKNADALAKCLGG